jgi:hypothetical protein
MRSLSHVIILGSIMVLEEWQTGACARAPAPGSKPKALLALRVRGPFKTTIPVIHAHEGTAAARAGASRFVTEKTGGMAIRARQIYALLRLARMPDGSKPLSDFLEDLDRSEASTASLFALGLVMGSRTPLGQITVTITEAGRDLLSPPADHYAFGLE